MNLWRQHFPMLTQTMQGKPLVYLDSAASAQKPDRVIDTVREFYERQYASVHRGVYELSAEATELYETVRNTVQSFLHAKYSHEIIFTSGTTASINLVAHGFAPLLKPQDEIIISAMEHHANIVPWQVICQQTGAVLKVINLDSQGNLDLNHYQQLLSAKTRLIALTHISNVLGTINPVKQMIAQARNYNIPVLLDGAQATPHVLVNVQDLDCDFYAFSAHKTYGPTGVGVLYGKSEWLERLRPYQTGGNMIRKVSFAETEYNELPHKFEAGTPNIVGVLGLGAALQFLQAIGMENIAAHERKLVIYAEQQLQLIKNLINLSVSQKKIGVFSLTMPKVHPHDIGTILDSEGIAVRAGHHCAMPLIERLNVSSTVRVSFGLYNEKQDIDKLCEGLEKVTTIFKPKFCS